MAHPSRVEFVQLTGQPRAIWGLEDVSFVPDKRFQLLAYLAYHADWIGRERLAFLFWPDTDTANSRQNLRGLLRRLRSLPWSAAVEATPHQLRWLVDTDVARHREALRQGREDEALDAYHGPLLLGLESDDAGEYGAWLEIERERLHGEWRSVALQRVGSLGRGEHWAAGALLRRLLEVDSLDEEAVRTYLRAMARAGRAGEARGVYQAFAARLREEMGLEPTADTVAAYEALASVPAPFEADAAGSEGVSSSSAPPASSSSATASSSSESASFSSAPPASYSSATASSSSAAPSGPVEGAAVEAAGPRRRGRDRLPVPATTFVGREQELAEVAERLRDPACRLLSVVGPGGVGKTRLALRAADQLREDFGDGVAFVPLDGVGSAENVPTAVAGALGVVLAAGGDPLAQVVRTLRDARTLLVLDNFEHVLDAVPVVSELLEAGPGIKLLVTSRERLHLAAEWLYPLEGFECPVEPAPFEAVLAFTAVALFVERARRVRPGFALAPRDVAAMALLCGLTRGLPLAIELAAVWVRALPLEAIARDVSRNLDLLATDVRDVAQRHRSIRATFEQSWTRLTAGERAVLRRLAVFRAAVPPEAAVFVAGASHAVLAALVDKSLLSLGHDGRYDRHPLLAAFAREKLDAEPEDRAATPRRHAAFYLRFLRERTDRARGPHPAGVLGEIDAALPEVLAAANAARAVGRAEDLVAFLRLLAVDTGYLPARGFGPEALELLQAAADAAVAAGWWAAAHDLWGRLGDAYGTHQGETQRALDAYRTAAELARRSGNLSREAVFVSMSGVMRSGLDPAGGAAELDRALALARAINDDLCLATVLEHRAFVVLMAEDWTASNALYRQSLDVVRRLEASQGAEPYDLNRRRFFALLNLGETEFRLGRFEEALAARREALRIAEAGANPIWAAHALQEMGEMHGAVGDDAIAEQYLRRAMELYRENHVMAHMDRLVAFMEAHGYALPADASTR